MFDCLGTASSVLRVCLLVVPLASVLGCAAPPQKEMDQAEGAIATARAAGAAQYASEEFSAAETALQRSHAAATERDFRQALNHALDARERAQTAAREAADKKALARGHAERAITAAELALAAARQSEEVPVPTPNVRRQAAAITAARKAFRTTLEAVATQLQEARSHLQAQRFDEALDAATPLPARIGEATATYEGVLRTVPAPRTGRRGR